MESIQLFFVKLIELMKIPFDLYGFQTSFWDIFIWSAFAILIARFIAKIRN